MIAAEPIRNKSFVKKLAYYYQSVGNMRNCIMILIGVYTGLRISDILRLKWEQVYDFQKKKVYSHIYLVEKKTGKSKIIALHKQLVRALTQFSAKSAHEGGFLIENPRTGKAISRIQAYRIIKTAAEKLELGRVSCHSLRKTFGYHAWKSGVSPAVIMDIYNHSSLAVTRRYLGVTQDEKNEVYLNLSIIE
jgi:integrase